jgi:hypothetical protein
MPSAAPQMPQERTGGRGRCSGEARATPREVRDIAEYFAKVRDIAEYFGRRPK